MKIHRLFDDTACKHCGKRAGLHKGTRQGRCPGTGPFPERQMLDPEYEAQVEKDWKDRCGAYWAERSTSFEPEE